MKKNFILAINVFIGICLVVTAVLMLMKYSTLPDTIPTHYDINGEPNGYGSNKSCFVLLGIAVLIYATMIFLQKKPHLLNTSMPVDSEGTPLHLTKTQWQQIIEGNVGMASLAISIIILMVCYIGLGVAQYYMPNGYVAAAGTILTLVVAGFARLPAQQGVIRKDRLHPPEDRGRTFALSAEDRQRHP